MSPLNSQAAKEKHAYKREKCHKLIKMVCNTKLSTVTVWGILTFLKTSAFCNAAMTHLLQDLLKTDYLNVQVKTINQDQNHPRQVSQTIQLK